jgi:hypothetical protein
MLNPEGKTPYPEWARPYTAVWEGDQWIVRFPSDYDAKRGLLLLQMEIHAPRLMAAPHPGGGAGWYVGLAD